MQFLSGVLAVLWFVCFADIAICYALSDPKEIGSAHVTAAVQTVISLAFFSLVGWVWLFGNQSVLQLHTVHDYLNFCVTLHCDCSLCSYIKFVMSFSLLKLVELCASSLHLVIVSFVPLSFGIFYTFSKHICSSPSLIYVGVRTEIWITKDTSQQLPNQCQNITQSHQQLLPKHHPSAMLIWHRLYVCAWTKQFLLSSEICIRPRSNTNFCE